MRYNWLLVLFGLVMGVSSCVGWWLANSAKQDLRDLEVQADVGEAYRVTAVKLVDQCRADYKQLDLEHHQLEKIHRGLRRDFDTLQYRVLTRETAEALRVHDGRAR